jgi:hypothetical protein
LSSELSGKKAILLVAAAIVGIFFVLQALFGFPIFKPKSDVVDNSAVVIIKDQSDGSCIVEASDRIPRSISECPYEKDDVITITYTEGTDQIKNHKP